MRADIEDESVGLHEPRIERVHRGDIALVIIVDAQRPLDATPRPLVVVHQSVRSAAASIAGSASLRKAGGGAFSSGNAPRPARISRRPTEGHELITASGIDNAGPAPL